MIFYKNDADLKREDIFAFGLVAMISGASFIGTPSPMKVLFGMLQLQSGVHGWEKRRLRCWRQEMGALIINLNFFLGNPSILIVSSITHRLLCINIS